MALLLRMLRIIEHTRNRCLQFVLIIPWPAGSSEDLRTHALAKPVADCGASGYDLDDVSYHFISNVEACHTAERLDEAITAAMEILMDSPPSAILAPRFIDFGPYA